MKYSTPARPAFTLIETFVAISILMITLVGPLTLAAQSLKTAYYARDEITAYYLAQEGIELVRGIRDQNYINGQSWLTGLDTCEGTGKNCEEDFPHNDVRACGGGGQPACGPLAVDQNGLYEFDFSGTPSPFTRLLNIVPVANNSANEVTVTVTVSWVSVGITQSINLSENLFNWL